MLFKKPRPVNTRIPLADLLKSWRQAKNMNTTQAGEMLGLSPRTVEGIEQGRDFRFEKLLRKFIEKS